MVEKHKRSLQQLLQACRLAGECVVSELCIEKSQDNALITEFRNTLDIAEANSRAALARTENGGSHYRSLRVIKHSKPQIRK